MAADIHAKYDGSYIMRLNHERGRTGCSLIWTVTKEHVESSSSIPMKNRHLTLLACFAANIWLSAAIQAKINTDNIPFRGHLRGPDSACFSVGLGIYVCLE